MFSKYYSNNRKFTLNIKITCSSPKRFRVFAGETGQKYSFYADREIDVEGSRLIYFSFPVSPKQLTIGCFNIANVEDNDYKVEISESPLKDYNIWVDNDSSSFLQLAVPFCQVCGYRIPPQAGLLLKSKDGQYNLKYLPTITDALTKQRLSTPARIGHATGLIEISAQKFFKYTVPMRLIILLHEFSHKYKNPIIGLEISNEIGADIQALYLYLGLGFSKIDAICVFANVFLKAQTNGNINRMRKILNYINRFESQEFAKLNG